MEITKEAYLEMLQKMDWFYYYSDDMRSVRAGENSLKNLENISKGSDILSKMFKDYMGYVYFNGEVELKPSKPKVEDYE